MAEIDRATVSPSIQAFLLGEVNIRVGSQTIFDDVWPLRSARSLLLLLLITPGHALPTERVLDALWPELGTEQGRNALYKSLHALRRVLEPDLEHGRKSSYIESRGGMTGLVSTVDVWVDAHESYAGLKHAATSDESERRDPLRRAIAAYGGELLPTDPYDDWPVAQREALRRAWEDAVLDLAALDLDSGEPQASVASLESLLAVDPAQESAHRALMRAYAATGQRDRALRQYSRCRAAIAEELGIGPDHETEALFSTIHDAEPDIKLDIVSPRFNNLPAEPTEIVGRDRESEAIQGLLWRQDVHLVTLTGPGGVGKTRLAIDAAGALVDDFADGVAFVPLASVRDPSLVIAAIAGTLGVSEEPDQTIGTSLLKHLIDREMVLVLDNVEHLLDSALDIHDLLAKCSGLSVLVTSRERLQLRGEHVFEVMPLAVPRRDHIPAPNMLTRYGSVALFQQNLRLHRPDFEITGENSEIVSAICVQLDGLPLAIELAAARGRFLTLPELLNGLVDRFALLSDGPRDLPPRHRTLRDTILWSHDLLTEDEQIVFRRLAVFVGGFTRDAVKAVCDTSGRNASGFRARLESLAEKHLIHWEDTEGEPHFTMLETVREFALEELRTSDEEAEIKQRHSEFYLRLALEAEKALTGANQVEWIERLDAQQGNLRSALDHGFNMPEESRRLAVSAAAALWRYWWIRGLLSEGISRLEQAIARHGTDPKSRAKALVAVANLVEIQSDYTRAESLFSEALEMYRQSGDAAGEAMALNGLGEIAELNGQYDRANDFHGQALKLYRQTGRLRESAGPLNNLATVAYYQGKYEQATTLWEDALAVVRELGDLRATGLLLGNLGSAAMTREDFDSAVSLHEENLAVARQLHDPGAIGIALSNLAEAVQLQGRQNGESDDLLAEALRLVRKQKDRHCEISVLTFMGTAAFQRGEVRQAASLFAQGVNLARETGDRTVLANVALLERIGDLAVNCFRTEKGITVIGACDAMRDELGSPIMPYLQAIRDRALEQASGHVGNDAIVSLLAEGRRLSQDAMFDTALAVCKHIEYEPPSLAPNP